MAERLQKILANAGLASRREIEKWIDAGRIKVNGKIAILGTRVSFKDKILVDDKPFYLNNTQVINQTIAYHKPVGQICSRNDPEGRDTVFSHLPKLKNQRWISVGRLDINTSGLLLFTTDGELANKLMHPSSEIEREYAVRVLGAVDVDMKKKLTHGVKLADGIAKFKSIKEAGGEGANHWYNVVLTEGKNREVRRMWEAIGVKVSRLIRVRYGEIKLNRTLQSGNWEQLTLDVITGVNIKKAERKQFNNKKRR
ncbi:Ribosomal large subunit pseudouridine synthase B [hydrothermal vent metagenome]|uniref:Ribosomal large subunit pseudouridine synthase B n=1 Tax=hydrothermal vent metagenome TaxID=652676 RepID=A0A3B1A0Y8_9ZZZZ